MTFFPVNTGFNCDKGHGYSQYNEKNEERASRGGGVAHITPEVAAALSLRIVPPIWIWILVFPKILWCQDTLWDFPPTDL